MAGHGQARIWVVEDSRTEAAAIARALGEIGPIVAFSSAEEMLDRLAAGPPELLILDWVLPGMLGIDVCRFVRESYDKLRLPVLMLTSLSAEEDLVQALSAGANDFALKPFRPVELRARVDSLLTLRELAEEKTTRERERTANAVNAARAAASLAESENLQKDQYIGILGHDLRNPLTAILAAAQAVRLMGDPRARRLADRVARSGERMASMVSDILDFARGRLGAGIPLAPADANLGSIAESVVDELTMTHPGRKIALGLTGELEGHWDPRRIEQVLSNLVGNALEHSDEEVTVGIAGQPKTATLTVHNMGPPIPSGDRDRLFEPFRKRESDQAGLGLGLYIVKLIVEAHGGTVDVRSTLETGTRFTCVLPKRRA